MYLMDRLRLKGVRLPRSMQIDGGRRRSRTFLSDYWCTSPKFQPTKTYPPDSLKRCTIFTDRTPKSQTQTKLINYYNFNRIKRVDGTGFEPMSRIPTPASHYTNRPIKVHYSHEPYTHAQTQNKTRL